MVITGIERTNNGFTTNIDCRVISGGGMSRNSWVFLHADC
jgi:hypothetical protein